MGGQVSRGVMCCSTRDKVEAEADSESQRLPQFHCCEVDTKMEQPVQVAVGPLHQREAGVTRRLVLASRTQVHVYKIQDAALLESQVPVLALTHTLQLCSPHHVVLTTGFCDDESSRHLAVSFGPADLSQGAGHGVQVWDCEATSPIYPVAWRTGEAYVASLNDHKAPVTRLAVNKLYVLTADVSGYCCLWQKGRNAFSRRSSLSLHLGGLADISLDRLFAYSCGTEDRRICAWRLPDLVQVLSIPVEFAKERLANLSWPSGLHSPLAEAAECRPPPVVPVGQLSLTGSPEPSVQVNLLRRPLSRWQGCSRGSKAPRGCLFAAGVLRDPWAKGTGCGVLMQWSLGERAAFLGMTLAHELPIVSLVYGPYDNGPLISCDARGVFRIWESTLSRGLWLCQQIDLPTAGFAGGGPAIAVEQPRAVYVAVGSNRLSVWHRYVA